MYVAVGGASLATLGLSSSRVAIAVAGRLLHVLRFDHMYTFRSK